MEKFSKNIEIRWADLDPNFHVLHSKYYDFGAFCRTAFLFEHGVTPAVMQAAMVGPILFKEECTFRKEIVFGDPVSIDVTLVAAAPDYSRWRFSHNLWKSEGKIAAIIIVEGAWLNLETRKLGKPTPQIVSLFDDAPRDQAFTFIK